MQSFLLGAQGSPKNWISHIDASHSRQPLVKGRCHKVGPERPQGALSERPKSIPKEVLLPPRWPHDGPGWSKTSPRLFIMAPCCLLGAPDPPQGGLGAPVERQDRPKAAQKARRKPQGGPIEFSRKPQAAQKEPKMTKMTPRRPHWGSKETPRGL